MQHLPKMLGLIAGAGQLPFSVVEACDEKNLPVFIVAFEGQTDPALVQGREHLWAKLGHIGTILKTLKAHGALDLVLVGSITRPSLSNIMPDMKAMEFLAGAGVKALSGDNDILVALRSFLEKEGFVLHGAQKFTENLLMPVGVLGKIKPTAAHQADIARGITITQQLGALDVGQGAVVQQGLVLAVEAIEGTDALLARARDMQRAGTGGVLVKTCKPQQDEDLDLPTAGLHTIKQAHAAGLAGVALHAGHSFLLDRQDVIDYADAHKLFIVGVDV